jgi:hypothetical protein
MPNRVRVLEIPESDRVVLERRVRDRGAPAREVQRARIVLLSSQGLTGPQIAERVGCTEPTVVLWRPRFTEEGLVGLEDRARRPAPRTTVTDEVRDEILRATLTRPPAELGIASRTGRAGCSPSGYVGRGRGSRMTRLAGCGASSGSSPKQNDHPRLKTVALRDTRRSRGLVTIQVFPLQRVCAGGDPILGRRVNIKSGRLICVI